MMKKLMGFFLGDRSAMMDEATIRNLNRMEREYQKTLIERELSLGTGRFIHRI